MVNTPKSSRQPSLAVQRDIREIMANISRTRQDTLNTSRRSMATRSSTEPTGSRISNSVSTKVSTSNARSVPVQQPSNEPHQTAEAKKKQILENSYAREMFFRHTDIAQVLARMLPERSETTRTKFAAQLYENYVLEPKHRIRKYLDAVRFNTRYNEGRFRMAIKIPITSAQEETAHIQKLTNAGIKKLCFVDMTANNLVLEHQGEIIETLKGRFRNWSGKLEKLPRYISIYQRKREADDRKFLSHLKHHSTLKGSWSLRLPDVVKELVRESRIPSEQRENLLWPELRFDDDALNQRYETGDYSKFQNDVDIEPDELIDYWQRRTFPIQDESRIEEGEIQLVAENGNFSAVRSKEVPEDVDSQPLNAPQNNHTFAIPSTTMLIPNETWEREIEINGNLPSANKIHQPTNRRVANQPKRGNYRVLRASCHARARHISYESDTCVDSTQNKDTSNTTNNAVNESIAFVPVIHDLQNAPSSQDSQIPNSETFAPFATSTQSDQCPATNIAEVPAATQDPLQLTGTVSSTMSPFNVIVPCDSGLIGPTENVLKPLIETIHSQTSSHPSSTIPPFQALKPTGSGLTPITNVVPLVSFSTKQEILHDFQSQADTSGYEDCVEHVPNSPDIIIIDSDSSNECLTAMDDIKT